MTKNQENILVSCNISEAKLPAVGAMLLNELVLELHLVAHKRQLYEEACTCVFLTIEPGSSKLLLSSGRYKRK
jgi:hypothetical protein